MNGFSALRFLKTSSATCQRVATGLVALVVLAVGGCAMQGRSLAQLNATAAPTHLQTQLRANPLAINSIHPRLSWVLPWKGRGQFQSAYDIL
ncbi:MAG: glycoside hydrolase family 78 protein, partial [Phycisphaerae bacterium]